jgi:A/G-specific adenine glycosylase
MSKRTVLSTQEVSGFRRVVYNHFKQHGRALPWRETRDPYKIMISEVMLQQTQVMRVIKKYTKFIEKFPDIQTLVAAPLQDVLNIWQGLGYNRRALSLKQLAGRVLRDYRGTIPSDPKTLQTLPGIGNATAHAICVFAHNQPVIFIETNIRTVYIHHFFPKRRNVSDREINPLVEATLDVKHPRKWYSALMDYGGSLKKEYLNPGRRSAHHQIQTPFKGSNRQIRGAVIQLLVERGQCSQQEMIEILQFDTHRVQRNITQLEREGFLTKRGQHLSIA